MKFKAGDVIEIVGGDETPDYALKWIGETATVTSVFIWSGREACRLDRCDDNRGWFADALRLKRPPSKDDAEPRADFTPCDADFSEWLKARTRVPS